MWNVWRTSSACLEPLYIHTVQDGFKTWSILNWLSWQIRQLNCQLFMSECGCAERKKIYFSTRTVHEICVDISGVNFNGREEEKKNLITDWVFCLCVFGCYSNCTVRPWEWRQTHTHTKELKRHKNSVRVLFSVNVVHVWWWYSGVPAQSLRLCSSLVVWPRHFSGFLKDGSKVCLV